VDFSFGIPSRPIKMKSAKADFANVGAVSTAGSTDFVVCCCRFNRRNLILQTMVQV
jgi:hypothetical protein